MRLRHSSSPLGSTGSSNESWPLSKDDYAEMYSPSHPGNNDDDEEDDANRNSTTEEERVSEEDDSWDQVNLLLILGSCKKKMVLTDRCATSLLS